MRKFSHLILLSSVLWACKEAPKTEDNSNSNTDGTTVTSKVAPVFSEDSAYKYIKNQVDFGPRVPNTKAHVACADYFVKFFKEQNLEVTEQKFDAKSWDGVVLKSRNIIASYNPTAQKRIIVASHWDTRPYADQDDDKSKQKQAILGANDGASGVGVIMELARILNNAKEKPNVGVDFILFDSEDYGQPTFAKGESKSEFWCLGSQYWSKNKHKPGYNAFYGILLDMVAAKDAKYYQEEGSVYFAKSVVDKVWAKGQQLGYSKHFINQSCPGITDDHLFVNQLSGIRMIDIIQYNDTSQSQFFGEYWHTHDDDMDVIDKSTLKALGHTLIEVIYQE